MMSSLPELSADLIEWGLETYKIMISEHLETAQVERELFHDIHPKVSQRGYFTKREIQLVLGWRRKVLPDHFNKNSEYRIKGITEEALNAVSNEIQIHILTLLYGIGITTASKMLMIVDPAKFCIMTKVHWHVLEQWGMIGTEYRESADAWTDYCRAITDFSEKHSLGGQQIDQLIVAIVNNYHLKQNSKQYQPIDLFF